MLEILIWHLMIADATCIFHWKGRNLKVKGVLPWWEKSDHYWQLFQAWAGHAPPQRWADLALMDMFVICYICVTLDPSPDSLPRDAEQINCLKVDWWWISDISYKLYASVYYNMPLFAFLKLRIQSSFWKKELPCKFHPIFQWAPLSLSNL